MSHSDQNSFLQRIWEKGVLQIILSYLVGAWAVIQFVDWLVNRYSISQNWTDICIVFLLALLPSVLLYTYFHGKTNSTKWNRIEKVIIPINILIAGLVVVFLFSSKILGATSEQITITNEDGEKIERLIPKTQFIKRLTFFPIKTTGFGDQNKAIAIALPLLQRMDLIQDNRIYGYSPLSLKDEYQRHGYSFSDEIPLSLQRKIASYFYSDYFVNGQVKNKNNQIELELNFHNTKDGEIFFSKTLQGSDLFDLVDQFSDAFRKAAYLPDNQSPHNKFVDLPARDLYTHNQEALMWFLKGSIANNIDNQPKKAIKHYEKALDIDANFALCYQALSSCHFRLSQKEEGKAAIEKAMSKIEILPERIQLDIKYRYYLSMEDNMEKPIALLEMWRQLYPSDYLPYNRLINTYQDKLELGKAKTVALDALNAGHGGRILLRLAYLNRRQGYLDTAIQYFEQFIEDFPDWANKTLDLGLIYKEKGEHEKAKQHFEKMELIDPNNIWAIAYTGQIEGDLGNFKKEKEKIESALSKAKIAKDSASMMRLLERAYFRTGHINETFRLKSKRLNQIEPLYLTSYQAKRELLWPETFAQYHSGNALPQLRKMCINYINTFAPNVEILFCITDLFYYLFQEDQKEKLLEVYEKCGDGFSQVMGPNEMKVGEGFFLKTKGELDKAAKVFESLDKDASDNFFKFTLGEIYIEMGNYEQATKIFSEILTSEPQYGQALYQLAIVYEKSGAIEKAKTTLDRALKIWENADENFLPAQQAKEKMLELTNNS